MFEAKTLRFIQNSEINYKTNESQQLVHKFYCIKLFQCLSQIVKMSKILIFEAAKFLIYLKFRIITKKNV